MKLKTIILAAGQPDPHSFGAGFKPICLLDYEGEVLLERSVRLLRKHGVKSIIVVVGYKAELIKQFAKKRDLDLKFVTSPHFHTKDAIDSFLIAIRSVSLTEPFILFMGDVTLKEEPLKALLEHHGHCICTSKNGREMFLAKFSLNTLGNLEAMRRWCTSYKWKGRFRPPLQVGLCQFLLKRGAKIVDKSMDDIDRYMDYKELSGHK